MTATQPITGIVAGFALVIDPNNEKGRRERIEYSDAAQMRTHVSRLRREGIEDYNANLNKRGWSPTETLYQTLYRRDDNGATEEEEGFDVSGGTNVGDAAYKMVCKCGKTAWFKRQLVEFAADMPATSFVCEDCNIGDPNDDGFNPYDGTQEREY